MAENKPEWLVRALDPSTPLYNNQSTIRTETATIEGQAILYPTIRMIDGELVELSSDEAFNMAMEKGDFLSFPNEEQATAASHELSQQVEQSRGYAEGGTVDDQMDEILQHRSSIGAVGASSDDTPIGMKDTGEILYANPNSGSPYSIEQAEPQRPIGSHIYEGAVTLGEFIKKWWDEGADLPSAGQVVKGAGAAGKAVIEGAEDEIGKALRLESTPGDIAGMTAGLGAAGSAMRVPTGALTSGAARRAPGGFTNTDNPKYNPLIKAEDDLIPALALSDYGEGVEEFSTLWFEFENPRFHDGNAGTKDLEDASEVIKGTLLPALKNRLDRAEDATDARNVEVDIDMVESIADKVLLGDMMPIEAGKFLQKELSEFTWPDLTKGMKQRDGDLRELFKSELDDELIKFYNPAASALEDLNWGKEGLKGENLNSFLEKRATKVRKSLVGSLVDPEGETLFDPKKRYTLDEAQALVNKNFGEVYAEERDFSLYESSQRMNFVQDYIDRGDDGYGGYGEILIKQDRDIPAKSKAGEGHYGANVIAHTRFSIRENFEGKKYILVEELQSDAVQQGFEPKKGPTPGTPGETLELALERKLNDYFDNFDTAVFRPNESNPKKETIKNAYAELYRDWNQSDYIEMRNLWGSNYDPSKWEPIADKLITKFLKDVDNSNGDLVRLYKEKRSKPEYADVPTDELEQVPWFGDEFGEDTQRLNDARKPPTPFWAALRSIDDAVRSKPIAGIPDNTRLASFDELDRDLLDKAKVFLLGDLESPIRPKPEKKGTKGVANPSVNSTTEFVRPLIHSLIAKAKKDGIDTIVIPPSSAFVKARGDGGVSEKALKSTYDEAVDKVLKELDREMGVDVEIGTMDIPTEGKVQLKERVREQYPDQIKLIEDAVSFMAADPAQGHYYRVGEGMSINDVLDAVDSFVRSSDNETMSPFAMASEEYKTFYDAAKAFVNERERGPDIMMKSRAITLGDIPKGKIRFAKGGAVMGNKLGPEAFKKYLQGGNMKKGYARGGMIDDGLEVDPLSGNEIPPGALSEEVSDTVDAKLSEGEFVFDAAATQYIGLKTLEEMTQEAHRALAEMEANGRIGGEPVDEQGRPMEAEDDDLPFDVSELRVASANTGKAGPKAFAEGGAVGAGFDYPAYAPPPGYDPKDLGFGSGSGFETRWYVDAAGNRRPIMFVNGNPVTAIPDGFYPEDEVPAEQKAEGEISTGSVRDWGSDGEGGGGSRERLSEQVAGVEREPVDYSTLTDEEIDRKVRNADLMGKFTKLGALLGPVGMAAGAFVNQAMAFENREFQDYLEQQLERDDLTPEQREQYLDNIKTLERNSGGKIGALLDSLVGDRQTGAIDPAIDPVREATSITRQIQNDIAGGALTHSYPTSGDSGSMYDPHSYPTSGDSGSMYDSSQKGSTSSGTDPISSKMDSDYNYTGSTGSGDRDYSSQPSSGTDSVSSKMDSDNYGSSHGTSSGSYNTDTSSGFTGSDASSFSEAGNTNTHDGYGFQKGGLVKKRKKKK